MLKPLLATKFYFPPAPSNLISRPRLVERLNAGLGGLLTLVSAPAGYGKTSLLSEWRASEAGRSFPLAWIFLDPDDNEPARFLALLVTALGAIQPGFGEILQISLQAPQPPLPHTLLTNFINELSEIQTPFALVLDDYHVITSQPVHEALAFLLDHLPPQIHLVILTRADPPVPLARLRARNQLTEIRAADLRFTQEEAAGFLNSRMGLAISAGDVDTLERRTEGWPAGLQLAALSLRGREDPAQFIAAFGGGNDYIVDFLVEEVLDRQSESLRMFLLQTSILDRMCAPLCDAILGDKEQGIRDREISLIPFSLSREMLDKLERTNLFIIPLDDIHRWYRYHHLFADVLQNRLRQFYPGMQAELHTRAAGWFEQNQYISEAIHHSLAANDRQHVAQLIEENAMAMLMRGELAALLSWIGSIEPLAHQRPWLSIYQLWALTLTGQLDRAEAWLQEAEQLVSSQAAVPEGEDQSGHIAAIRAYQAAQRGEALKAIHLADQALKLLPEKNQAVRSVVMLTLGTSRRLSGDLPGAARDFEEAMRVGQSAGNFYLALGALSSLADLLYDQGQLHQAFVTYREILERTTRPDGQYLPAAGMAFFGLGLIGYEWNELETAFQQTRQSIELCQKWGNVGILIGSYALLFCIQQALGDNESARAAFYEAERLARENPLAPRAVSWVEALRAKSWLAQGDIDAAGRWAEQRKLNIEDDFTLLREFEYLALVRILLAQKNSTAAIFLSDRMRHSAEAAGRRGALIEILLLQALAYLEMGDYSSGWAALEQALSLAEPEGYVRMFLDEGAPMAKLLRHAGSKGLTPKYISWLLTQFEGKALITQQPLIEPLSERELEILRLIASGKSNQEIAAQLVISVGTVKSHLSHIFNKLNVDSRTQCVARARELKLLS